MSGSPWMALLRWRFEAPCRVRMILPCSSRERAEWLRTLLFGPARAEMRRGRQGRVEDGALIVEGRALLEVARRFGLDRDEPQLWQALTEWHAARHESGRDSREADEAWRRVQKATE